MELRAKKAVSLLAAACFWLAPALWSQPYEFQVRHDHWRGGCQGTLRVDERGISFTETGKKRNRHSREWIWQDIQRLELAPGRLRVLTYKDILWKLGADRQYEFDIISGQRFDQVYTLLKDRLDQRFVAELADDSVKPLWEIPVKRLGRIRGSEGVLIVGENRVVYRSQRDKESMTWRYSDIENISYSGPFALTLTTLEKNFNFQLKQALDEKRFNLLWRRLNQAKGLEFLTSLQDKVLQVNSMPSPRQQSLLDISEQVRHVLDADAQTNQ